MKTPFSLTKSSLFVLPVFLAGFALAQTSNNPAIESTNPEPLNQVETPEAEAEDETQYQGFLGVNLQELSPDLATFLQYRGEGGVVVLQVMEGTPAESAGLQRGDVIVNFAGTPILHMWQLIEEVSKRDPGEEVFLELMRRGQQLRFKVTLGKMKKRILSNVRPNVRSRANRALLPNVSQGDFDGDGDIDLRLESSKLYRQPVDPATQSQPTDEELLKALEPGDPDQFAQNQPLNRPPFQPGLPPGFGQSPAMDQFEEQFRRHMEEMASLHNRLGRLMWDLNDDALLMPGAGIGRAGNNNFGADLRGSASFTPRIDMQENDEAYIVRIDLPGADPEQIALTVEENQLIVSGKRDDLIEEKTENGMIIRRERRTGSFSRTLPLPTPIDPSGMTKEAVEGVIVITLPKASATDSNE